MLSSDLTGEIADSDAFLEVVRLDMERGDGGEEVRKILEAI